MASFVIAAHWSHLYKYHGNKRLHFLNVDFVYMFREFENI